MRWQCHHPQGGMWQSCRPSGLAGCPCPASQASPLHETLHPSRSARTPHCMRTCHAEAGGGPRTTLRRRLQLARTPSLPPLSASSLLLQLMAAVRPAAWIWRAPSGCCRRAGQGCRARSGPCWASAARIRQWRLQHGLEKQRCGLGRPGRGLRDVMHREHCGGCLAVTGCVSCVRAGRRGSCVVAHAIQANKYLTAVQLCLQPPSCTHS